MPSPSGHARLSPSAGSRWTVCPGSVEACAGIESPDTEHSMKGTAGHHAHAEWLLHGSPPEVGTKAPNGIVLTQEIVDAAGMGVGWIRQYVEGKVHHLLVETEVEIGAFFGLPAGVCWGTADAVILMADGELVIYDLKLGYLPVDPEENVQLMLYAAGIIRELGVLFDRVRFVIAQPANGGIKEWEVSLADLLARLEEMKPKVVAATLPDAPFKAEPKACKWCPIFGTCAEAQREALALARQQFTSPASMVEHITVEDLALLLKKSEMVEEAIKAARGKALSLLAAGIDVPGYKRVEANTKRRWKKGVEAEVEKLVGKEKAYEKKLVSFTVVEKLAGEAAIANLVEKPKGEAVLAPLSAKGAALPPDLQSFDSGMIALLE
jgi:RecB family exonuclease